jgi:predicted  nucleic acid-binding Zn-ribbon protein
MTAEIERLRATNAAMTRDIARMNAQITGLEEDLEKAEAERDRLRAVLQAMMAEFDKFSRYGSRIVSDANTAIRAAGAARAALSTTPLEPR